MSVDVTLLCPGIAFPNWASLTHATRREIFLCQNVILSFVDCGFGLTALSQSNFAEA